VAGGATFAEVAVARSTDASAGRGGLLEPIGRQDPRYPEGMRTTLWSLRLGEISDPVMLNSQYALLRLESEIPGDGVALDDVRPQMERLARLQLERAAMDGKARSLLAETDVVIFDPPLRNGWEQRLNR
jgi:parvulin-like peptidyl-prolyl isomerase